MTDNNYVLFPAGRMVQGDLYNPQTTDIKGNPLVFKTGAKAGQPRVVYYMAVAIPKGPETSWNETEWGRELVRIANQNWLNGEPQRPAFSWKVEDGDSTVPNKNNKRNCDQEGMPGNWIVKASTSFMPILTDRNGDKQLVEPGAIKSGYYVQLYANVRHNGSSSQENPGIIINPVAVALVGYGEEIISYDLDTKSIGFGAGPVPAGAMPHPPAGNFNPAQPAPAQPAPAPAAAPAQPAPVPEVLEPPKPALKQMTAKANGLTYEQYIQAGWTDEQLIAHGLLQV